MLVQFNLMVLSDTIKELRQDDLPLVISAKLSTYKGESELVINSDNPYLSVSIRGDKVLPTDINVNSNIPESWILLGLNSDSLSLGLFIENHIINLCDDCLDNM
ncbi:hypothetical protein [Photobacterium leiognathi]|uniref:hypothetical protein n=1 Tax=Photobacterium leiognathi TaxID=553611 RepID=UPI0029827F82|nr:hypothetical protein [Photobacterium leiognathi]